ncbi:RNase H domain-containing protein [Trichonephila clavipes]|nr:RNase H domain-containing protein [Trichonephila clavipes]
MRIAHLALSHWLRNFNHLHISYQTTFLPSWIKPIEFQEELLASTPKHSSHPELLKQLALEVINGIPYQALIIYTDGSRSDSGREGSGIFSNTPGNDVKISIRNCNYCSDFRPELIAISDVLDHALNSNMGSIWILTDSRNSIQYLKNWPKSMDSTGLDIILKLARLGQRKQVCLQLIPSSMGVPGNEAADELAGRGCGFLNPSSSVVSHSEIHSLHRAKKNLTWRNPPAHHWYVAKSHGLSLQCSSRALQTALARFRSGHLRAGVEIECELRHVASKAVVSQKHLDQEKYILENQKIELLESNLEQNVLPKLEIENTVQTLSLRRKEVEEKRNLVEKIWEILYFRLQKKTRAL